MPAIELTMPSGAPAAASVGPCSMCSSTKHAGGGSSQPARGSSPSPSDANASAREMPSASRRSPSSSSSCPQIARLPNTPRPKRGPSSRRKAMTTRPRRGAPPARDRLGGVERAEHAEGAVEAPAVGRRVEMRTAPDLGQIRLAARQAVPTRLPAGSRVTSRPASRIQPATSSWARSSPGPSPGLLVPAAMPISKSVSRRSRMRRARHSGVAARGAPEVSPRSLLTLPSMQHAGFPLRWTRLRYLTRVRECRWWSGCAPSTES